jgi:hypothetical protein
MSTSRFDTVTLLEHLSVLADNSPEPQHTVAGLSLAELVVDEPRVHYFSVARDFTDTPGGRTRQMHAEPGFSGEELRARLVPLLRDCLDPATPAQVLVVDLDGTAGYAASFLDEAFGGMVREGELDYFKLLGKLILVDTEYGPGQQPTSQEVLNYLSEAYQDTQAPVVILKGPFGRNQTFTYYILPKQDADRIEADNGFAHGVTIAHRCKRHEADAWLLANPIA